MLWRESKDDAVTILRLEGEIDLNTSPELRGVLREKCAARCAALVVDFGAVSYLDSSALATLIEYWRNAQRFGGKLALAGVSERLHTIFEVARLTEILAIFPTVEAAIAALKT